MLPLPAWAQRIPLANSKNEIRRDKTFCMGSSQKKAFGKAGTEPPSA
jgi:hypothetical protein